jgi:hypothetical protein
MELGCAAGVTCFDIAPFANGIEHSDISGTESCGFLFE